MICDYFEVENYEDSMAQKAAELPVLTGHDETGNEEHFQQHGEKVVETISQKGGIEAVKDFEVSWRQHFLDVMDPKVCMKF